jgi:osmoprotectant transport system permease protein
MWVKIAAYFADSSDRYLTMLADHLKISLLAFLIAAAIAVPAGWLCVRFSRWEKVINGFFGVLRVIPSLAVLLLILPLLGTGTVPAAVALVLLAIPPILMNTAAGLRGVEPFLLETAEAMGMEPNQVWTRVRFPLAMPMVMTGLKTAAVEIISGATLAAKIGAGGLGDIIFTGIGLYRTDLLIIGGVTVAALSLTTGLLFAVIEKVLFPYNNV